MAVGAARIALGDVWPNTLVVELRGRVRVWPWLGVAGVLAAAAPLGMPSPWLWKPLQG
jgi:hypothetical protein